MSCVWLVNPLFYFLKQQQAIFGSSTERDSARVGEKREKEIIKSGLLQKGKRPSIHSSINVWKDENTIAWAGNSHLPTCYSVNSNGKLAFSGKRSDWFNALSVSIYRNI